VIEDVAETHSVRNLDQLVEDPLAFAAEEAVETAAEVAVHFVAHCFLAA